jgi:thiamine-phosphate pyrophosphorylase
VAESQLYSIIDRGLAQLSEHLNMLSQLMQSNEETKETFAHLIELYRRFEIEERLLRIRFALEKPALQDKPATYLLLKNKPESQDELSTMVHLRLRAAQEVARSLEEYFRFFRIPRVGGFFKRLRFDLYEMERQATVHLGPPEVEAPPEDEETEHDATHSRVIQALAYSPLYFVVDESLCEFRDPARVAYDAVQGGVRMLQLRLKTAHTRQLLETARKVRRVCAQNNCLFIMNDRLDIALLSGADGIHVGRADLPVEDIRHLGSDLVVGVTCRKPQEALAAQSAGADYIGSGSVFGSQTKPGLPVIGTRGLARIAQSVDIPVVGIGGVTFENAKEALDAGAAGVCSIQPFKAQRSIVNLAAKFRELKK